MSLAVVDACPRRKNVLKKKQRIAKGRTFRKQKFDLIDRYSARMFGRWSIQIS